MKILAIETSCDDTGIAVLKVEKNRKFDFKTLANVVSSQIKIHQQYGGVFPMMASREHQKNLIPVTIKAIAQAKLLDKKSGKISTAKNSILKNILKRERELYTNVKKFLQTYKKPKIDLIAVTCGPGLEPCLWVGLNFAIALSYFWKISLLPINHIESHILVNYLSDSKIKFPAISLVVSGGHTQLILMKNIGKYEIIGETRDDAAGECFDKCAKLLGLGYPGGPIISKLAEKVTESKIILPRPMINTKDYDFSFSGLKTAVLYKIKDYLNNEKRKLDENFIQEMCYGVQQSIIDVLLKKTIRAVKNFQAKTVILGGGVSANKELRKQMGEALKEENPRVNYIIPDAKLSTDNGLMVAVAAWFHRSEKIYPKFNNLSKLRVNANLRVSK